MIFDPEKLAYAFGHLASSYNTEDAHASDSGALARELLAEDLALNPDEMELIEAVAEHVAANYTYTGEGIETERKIRSGDL